MWKIVIVEDEDLLRNGLIHVIDWAKFGFEVAGDEDNGEKGLQLIYEVHPDVVLTDIRMSIMDGLAMSEKVKDWDSNIRIVFLSGYDEFDYARRALKLGAEEYILKPIQIPQVEEILQRLSDELEKEHSQKEKMQKMQQISRIGAAEIRQKIYTSMLTNKEVTPELKKYEEVLSEEEKNHYYAAILVGQRDFPSMTINADYIQIRELDHEFSRELHGLLEEVDCTILHSTLCERVLIFHDANIQNIKNRMEQCREKLRKHAGEKFYYQCAIGTPYHWIGSLPKSYADAKEKMNAQFLMDWTDQLIRKDGVEEYDFISYDKKALLAAIQSGNLDRVNEQCNELEEVMTNHKVVSQLHMILTLTSIFEKMVSLSDQLVWAKSDRNPMEDFTSIMAGSNRAKILSSFREYCLELSEYFSTSGKSAKEGNAQSSIRLALDYINQEYTNPGLTLDSVAKYAYISNGIPVILVDRGLNGTAGTEYTMEIMSDFVWEAAQIADYLIKDGGGKGNVVVLEGTQGATSTTERQQGFVDTIEGTELTIVADQVADYSMDKAQEVMENILQAQGDDIDYVFCHNDDMALGAIQAIEAAGYEPGVDIKVAGIDGPAAAMEAILAGKELCSCSCSPLFGPITFEAIAKIVSGAEYEESITNEDTLYDINNAAVELGF